MGLWCPIASGEGNRTRAEVARQLSARVRGRIDLMLWANGGDRRVELIDLETLESRPFFEIEVNQLRHTFGSDDREREAFAARVEEGSDGIRRGDFQPVEDRSICPDCKLAEVLPLCSRRGESFTLNRR